MRNNKPLHIALSGIDGAGKSTQLELLQSQYQHQGKSVIYLWTRGGNTPGVEGLKAFSRKLLGKKLPPSGHSKKRDEMLGRAWVQYAWLVLAMLDLMWIYAICVRWWLWQGKVVICDRYLWDTLIDFKIMFPDLSVENWPLWKILVWATPKPELQCLLMIPLELSEKRCAQKYEPFPDTPKRRARRYDLYMEVSSLNHWKVLDSTLPVEAVFENIRSYLS